MNRLPEAQGLYDPRLEKDGCGLGFVAHCKGERSRDIVQQGLELLKNLSHRGATGADSDVGDGAGILLQLPDAFFRAVIPALGFALPPRYGVGMLFLPAAEGQRAVCESVINDRIVQEGCRVLGWRTVPVLPQCLGRSARENMPYVRQVFMGPAQEEPESSTAAAFERRLYIIRRLAEKGVREAKVEDFSIPSFSSRTIIYKGMFTPGQLGEVYPDLNHPELVSSIAVVHARYSTNTFPSWHLAHPYRMMAHNGEINTVRGNINWMRARENNLASTLFGTELPKLFPVIDPSLSDSAIFDQVLEFLVQTGRSPPHAMMLMNPEVWDGNAHMDANRRAFFQYHATLMEPWDGPAALIFSDGSLVGATLDRNGLRPARIMVTKDNRVIMASEAGVLPVAPENVAYKTRLRPGRVFVVDPERGGVLDDDAVKNAIIDQHPYQEWVRRYTIELGELAEPPHVHQPDHQTVVRRQQVFGYTKEDLKFILPPMGEMAQDPVGSMGVDIPLAVLSQRPRLLFNYFKQNFAQVTNPAIDPIREELVMSLVTFLGKEGNLLDPSPANAHVLRLSQPILTNYELEKLRHVTVGDFQAKTLPILFRVEQGTQGMQAALAALNARADKALAEGYSLIILTDRGVDHEHAAIPSLLATACLHHHLIRQASRCKVSLIVETGEAREVHHFALLLGYGATAVNPYLAFETQVDENTRFRADSQEGVPKPIQNYIKSINKGLLKVMSKMGISTLQSYHGAQIFEALGLNRDVIDRYFTGTFSRIQGIGLAEIAAEVLQRHAYAYPEGDGRNLFLDVGGIYQYRREGEHHLLNPDSIAALQSAVRLESEADYLRWAELQNEQSERLGTLRGLFVFKPDPIPLEEVEPVNEILKHFATGAMSLGSISREAHETLAIAMNRIGGKSNTGEGGEDPRRFSPDESGNVRNSAIKQVASGRFGVNSHYLVNAQELQIKISQGAKPGEGGQLPGHKVDAYIGSIRFTTPGVGLISPPPHHDIYSIEDIKQLIFDLKNVNPQARISVKLVSETGVGTVAAGVAKAKADVVLISGHDGGTGASPLTSIQHAGTPWEIGLAETQQILVLNNLRGRICVQTDGKLSTGRDVVIAALLGAEEFGFSTAPLVAMGCVMMRVCHLNTCPVGIATQDPRLRERFAGLPEHVTRYFVFVAQEVRRWMAELGFRTMAEMIGRVDRLETRQAIDHWKARGLDFSAILYAPPVEPSIARHQVQAQDHNIADILDHKLIEWSRDALEEGKPVRIDLPIYNHNLATATMLGGALTRRYGSQGLPDNTIQIHFTGSSGQSFGAFLPKGISLFLEGEANDYIGKGLSGGQIVVKVPQASTFVPEENIIIGNVALYGATAGQAYFNGMAGERFAVRNSGARVVVEGVGDHACEYMTGGEVLVLGQTGLNFAAGMSGGIAYVLDEDGAFASRCNMDMVGLETLDEEDKERLETLVRGHVQLTSSPKGQRLLNDWETTLTRFAKVMPVDYKRILEERKDQQHKDIA